MPQGNVKKNSAPSSGETPAAGRHQTLLAACVCGLLLLAVFLVFGQTARFAFVDYDDGQNVYQNDAVERGLSWRGVKWAFTHPQVASWVPLTTLSHMLDCQIFGPQAGGHHAVNALWHGANAVVLFLALRQMSGRIWPSAFVAMIFAVHPLRAESVAWVSERKDVLSGFFFLLAVAIYVRDTQRPFRGGRVLLWLLFALALLAKSMAATLPFVLLLLDYWPLNRFHNAREFWPLVKEKVPLLALGAASCAAAALVPGLIVGHGQSLPFLERAGNALVSYVVYMRQMFFPSGLATPYPLPPGGIPMWKISLAFLLLSAMTAGVMACRKKAPYLLVGWFWYLGVLFPVIGIVQISSDAAHADRYTYLAEIGLSVAAAWAVADWSAHWKHRSVALAIVMLAAVVPLTVLGRIQTSYWKDSETLWRHSLACTSGNFAAHCNLGCAFFDQGKMAPAISEYQKALEIQPNYTEAHYNLGIALSQEGKLDEAIAQFRTSLELAPEKTEALNNLGNTLLRKGATEEALAQFQKAVRIEPDFAEARYNLGNLFLKERKLDEAIEQYRKTLDITPENASALNNLGNALAMKGNDDEAMAEYRQALEFRPGLTDARQNLASLLQAHGKLDDAIAQYRAVVKAKPGDGKARANLEKALLQKGDVAGTIQSLRDALKMNPNQPSVQNNLAWLLATAPDASLRNPTEAAALATKANEASGGADPAILRTLASAYAGQGSNGLAVATAQRALQLATLQRKDGLAAMLQKEIGRYEANPSGR